MQFERLLALRYFRSKRGTSRFTSFIQWITVGGIAVGSGGLLLAFSLTNGFSEVIRNKLFEFGSHIRVETFGDYPVYQADTVAAQVMKMPSVASAEIVAEMQAMIQLQSRVEGFMLRGVSRLEAFPYLAQYSIEGNPSLDSLEGRPAIILGSGLARQLDAKTGRTVTVFAIDAENKTRGYSIRQFCVSAIFHTGIDELDGLQAFVRLDHAQYLKGLGPGSGDYVEIRLKDGEPIWKTDDALNDGSLFPYHTVTVFEYYSNIFAWVMLQEKTIPVVISALVLIAAFNLIGTVLMMVLERTGDIGILRTFGASPGQIRSIFLMEGLLLSLSGLAAGLVLAFGLIALENRFHFISLPEENYYMSTVSFSTEWWQLLVVFAVTVSLSLASSWIPARYASRIKPVSTLQFGK